MGLFLLGTAETANGHCTVGETVSFVAICAASVAKFPLLLFSWQSGRLLVDCTAF